MSIIIDNLYKRFGSKVALNGINLEIKQGMFGLLGSNGAGKTTLMRILTTLVPPTSGDVIINGHNINERKTIRSIIGYLPQDFSIYPSFSVYEAMDYLGILSGIVDSKKRRTRINYLLEAVNLDNVEKVKVKALSGGMKRRLGIAQAILSDPQILIVDEPTAGLDPEERIRFRNMLEGFASNRIVILSTHIVEDIESTCEMIAILKEGEIAYTGKVRVLLQESQGYIWSGIVNTEGFNNIKNKKIIISSVSEALGIRVRILSAQKPFESAEAIVPSIEDGYMKVMKGV